MRSCLLNPISLGLEQQVWVLIVYLRLLVIMIGH